MSLLLASIKFLFLDPLLRHQTHWGILCSYVVHFSSCEIVSMTYILDFFVSDHVTSHPTRRYFLFLSLLSRFFFNHESCLSSLFISKLNLRALLAKTALIRFGSFEFSTHLLGLEHLFVGLFGSEAAYGTNLWEFVLDLSYVVLTFKHIGSFH